MGKDWSQPSPYTDIGLFFITAPNGFCILIDLERRTQLTKPVHNWPNGLYTEKALLLGQKKINTILYSNTISLSINHSIKLNGMRIQSTQFYTSQDKDKSCM